MTEESHPCDLPEARQFDFMIGTWTILNKLKREDKWVEFPATTVGKKVLNGCTIIDEYDATLPNGLKRKGITIRAFNHETREWSLVWLDDRYPPDFRPVVGKFIDGVGLFYQDDPMPGTTHLRFMWDNITETTARWQQAFSTDGGETWDTHWIMEFSR